MRRYLDELSRESLTQQIKHVLDLRDYEEEAAELAAAASRR